MEESIKTTQKTIQNCELLYFNLAIILELLVRNLDIGYFLLHIHVFKQRDIISLFEKKAEESRKEIKI